MLEIIYRIYEVLDKEKMLENNHEFGFWSQTNAFHNKELLMDCMIVDSRDEFKEIIRDTYGKDIGFKYNDKKMKAGDLYCVIIGEHCYNTEKYFNKITFKCDNCGAEIETYYSKPICFFDSEIKYDFYGIEKYKKMRFCSAKCKEQFKEDETNTLNPSDDQEFFVTRDMFKNEKLNGWIYKITKKSTGEFYIGQTMYVPVFRWGQHLKTERFPVENITDYKFEVIEEVKSDQNILEREKYWIHEYCELPTT